MKKTHTSQSVTIIFAVITAFIFILSGCKNNQPKQDKGASAGGPPVDKEVVIKDLTGYPIPTSYEITKVIYKSGAPYILSLSNGPEKAGDYITQRDKALNLGAYATDLCYATTYMMKQGTLNYLEASKILIDDLGISTTFNVTYAERIESNMDNRDSLIMIVSESFGDTWNYLVLNKQDVLARLVVCGSWIEGIYITSHVGLKALDNTELLEILAKQKKALNNLVNSMEPVKAEAEARDIYEALFELQAIFDEVEDPMTVEQLGDVATRIKVLRDMFI